MTENHDQKHRSAAEDRAALRAEIATGGADDTTMQAFDRLAKQADEQDGDTPPMPDDLREKLVEKFGESVPKAAPVSNRAVPAAPGFFAQLREFFAGRELAYGGFAVAVCALLLTVFLPRGGGVTGGGDVDTLRGGGADAGETLEVAIYLFPEANADAVVAIMNPERPAVVCRDAADFAQRLSADAPVHAVAADLEAGTVSTYRDGQLVEESALEVGDATSVLLDVRAATDALSGGAE